MWLRTHMPYFHACCTPSGQHISPARGTRSPDPCSFNATGTSHSDCLSLRAALTIVCSGPTFRGTFSNCKFETARLIVAHGAAVTLRDCAFMQSSPAVIASGPESGPESFATLRFCRFTTCAIALLAEAGGTILAAQLFVDNPSCRFRFVTRGA